MTMYRSLFAGLLLALGNNAFAVTVTVNVTDSAGEGFNDPAIVAALPNNPGTTLGQQRLNVFQQAANQWGAVLTSVPNIVINAAFNPLTCSGTSAVLGSAGATGSVRNFAGAVLTNTWYVAAEANALSGTDLNAGTAEITAQFNTDIDANPNCLTGTTGWWYGLDTTQPIPAGKVALMPVVFHEIAHGLGFLTITNTSTGALSGGFPDIWANFMADGNLPNAVAGTPFSLWKDMTNTQRAASAIDDPNLVWTGANVTNAGNGHLGPTSILKVNSPAGIAGNKAAQTASFGLPIPLTGVTKDVVLALDTGASTTDGCETITNVAAISGKFALIDRGTCTFVVKALNAQAAGAAGLIVVNNVAAGLPGMGGADPTITLFSLGISQADGTAIKTALTTGTVNATMGFDFSALSGQAGGFVRLFAPNPLQQGSSVSHFSVDANPNLLMEPSLNQELFSKTDLTVPLFRDIHWPVNNAAIANLPPTVNAASLFSAAPATPKPLTEIFFSDPDAGANSITVSFQLGAGTGAGVINLAAAVGVTASGSGTINASIAGTRLALLQYVVTGNVQFLGSALGTLPLTITVNDNGNSGTGSALTATANATVSISVPNVAPTISAAGTLNGTEDVALPVTGYTLADADAGAANVTLTIAANSGTLTASAGGGVSVTGSSTANLVLTGSIASLQTFANGGAVTFSLGANLSGAATLTSTINDLGNSGSGGALTAQATTNVAIAAVNDAPQAVGTLPNITSGAGVALNIPTAGGFADVDNPTLSYSVASVPALPAGVTISGSSGVISGTPAVGVTGIFTVTVTASDAQPLTAQQTFTLTIQGDAVFANGFE